MVFFNGGSILLRWRRNEEEGGGLPTEGDHRGKSVAGAKRSMRTEDLKKEGKLKKVCAVYAIVLSHCHCFFSTAP